MLFSILGGMVGICMYFIDPGADSAPTVFLTLLVINVIEFLYINDGVSLIFHSKMVIFELNNACSYRICASPSVMWYVPSRRTDPLHACA